MSQLEVIVVGIVGGWLLVLTFIVVLVVRQVGLVTVRLSHIAPYTPPDESGPPIGSPVPQRLTKLFPGGSVANVLLLSATCSPCRDLASSLSSESLTTPTVALVSGRPKPAREVASMLPSSVETHLDPLAAEVAEELGIEMVPFGIRIRNDRIENKAYLNRPEDLILLERVSRSDEADSARHDDRETSSLKELISVVRAGRNGHE